MRRKGVRIALAVLVSLLLAVLILPLVIPIPPLEGTRPPRELADPDSRFVEIDGLELHVKTQGNGEPVFVLLHGFAASLYSWHAVMEPLSQLGRVIAYDRPGFGLSERPLAWEGRNPYSAEAQMAQLIGLLDELGVGQAILVGHSAGGALAMQAALDHPERVSALVLVDPAVYTGGGAPTWLQPLLHTPQMRRLGPLVVRQIRARGDSLIRTAWHDPTRLTPKVLQLYTRPLQADNWDRGLWEFTLASRPSGLSARLGELRFPILVVTGDDDRIVPTADSLRLAEELPNAALAIIAEAGHVPHEERPDEFMDAVGSFIRSMP